MGSMGPCMLTLRVLRLIRRGCSAPSPSAGARADDQGRVSMSIPPVRQFHVRGCVGSNPPFLRCRFCPSRVSKLPSTASIPPLVSDCLGVASWMCGAPGRSAAGEHIARLVISAATSCVYASSRPATCRFSAEHHWTQDGRPLLRPRSGVLDHGAPCHWTILNALQDILFHHLSYGPPTPKHAFPGLLASPSLADGRRFFQVIVCAALGRGG